MTSRRPMTRSYSGNGRSGSQNGEDVPSPGGRSESRNYLSNVRPENRSTLCTVMAQLTEETQPCFETTIKSKAVSETCNVKFSCVVTGYPAPELTWYKDDMELDRYCGLPKYEIFRNGKTHTLHIYNCTEDDAAIYQASARNSKGIVSCSGVLEVGTMSEYMIHQRFFAKLKQKAENKRKELEESRRRGKENIQKEQLNVINQERLLRKRRTPAGIEPLSSSPITQDGEETMTPQGQEEEQTIVKNESNALQASVGIIETTRENVIEKLNHISESTEQVGTKQPLKEKPDEKKMRITNGFDGFVSPTQNKTIQDDSEEMSLAKYLAETVHSQNAEQQQRPSNMDTEVHLQETQQEKVLEKEREQLKEDEKERSRKKEREAERQREQVKERVRQKEREKDQERERQKELEHEREREKIRQKDQEERLPSLASTKTTPQKEPEHKSTLTSVFHSLKDIFFGKSKKSSDAAETRRTSVENEIQHEYQVLSSQMAPRESSIDSLAYKRDTSQVVDLEVKTNSLSSKEDAPKLVEKVSETAVLEVKTSTLDSNLVIKSYETDHLDVKNDVLATESSVPKAIDDLRVKTSVPQMQDLIVSTEFKNCILVESKFESATNQSEDGSPTSEQKTESTRPTLGLSPDQKEIPEEDTISEDVSQSSHSQLFKVKEDHSIPSRIEVPDSLDIIIATCETEKLKCTVDEVMQGAEELHVVEGHEGPAAPLSDLITVDLESMQCCQSQPESQLSQLAAFTSIQLHIESQPDELREQDSVELLDSKKEPILHMEEESRLEKTLEGDSWVEKNKAWDGAIDKKYLAPVENETKSNLIDSIPHAIEVRDKECEMNDQNSLPSALVQEEQLSESAMEIDLTPEEISIPEINLNTPENKEVVTEMTVDDINAQGNIMDKGIPSLCMNVEEQGDLKVEMRAQKEEQTDNANAKKDDSCQSKKNEVKKSKNPAPEMRVSIVIPAKEVPKNEKQLEVDLTETHPKLNKVDKSKFPSKIDRRLMEKDQSAVPPIIILPDTRETVIKNVAKKRSTPLLPEIKVTVPERIKREEPVMATKSEILKVESERIGQLLTQEGSHVLRERERQVEDATRPSGDSKSTLNISDHLSMTRNTQSSQDVKPQNLSDHTNLSTGMAREEESKIPVINIACAEDGALQQKQSQSQPSLPGIVISQDVTQAIPSTSPTNDEREDQGVSAILKCESNQHRSVANSEKPKDQLIFELNLDGNQDMDRVPKLKDTKAEPDSDKIQKDKPSIDKNTLTTPVGPTLPPLSPASLRRLLAKNNPNLDNQGTHSSASVDGSEKKGEESGGSTPTSALSCESSPKMKRRDSLTLIPSATPEELASGARRKIYLAKTKSEDEGSDTQPKRDSPYMSPSQARRAAFLQLQSGQQTPPTERRSPLLSRRKATLEVPKAKEEIAEVLDNNKTQQKQAEKEKFDPFKAPQVIRKIRGEPFSDASSHLKLWCQFFNILSDSTIKWYRDEEEILEMERRAGDEGPVALAIVQASSKDCGVYGCSIKNDYGTDTTDYLLSTDILAEFLLREDLEVGEEIEMTPMMFTKGLADSGYWGEKFFGRIMTEEVQIGEGYVHKTCRAKVIYGLDPIFESGSTCITKVRNPIAYGAKEESNLAERNLEITKQDCKIQNTVREYCKIFAAEARVIENFGFSLEVIPLHLMYRPANTIPYASVETDLKGMYVKYCVTDSEGRLTAKSSSELEQKCCTFQHWIHQWTNGNLLVTRLEGVDAKMTSIEIVTKSKGYQGLTEKASPKIIEQFVAQHQCNYYCGLLSLRPLKLMDSQQQPKIKISRSPLLARRSGTSSSSPQLQKKGTSPQSTRRGTSSPKVLKKTGEGGENNSTTKHKAVEVPKPVRMR